MFYGYSHQDNQFFDILDVLQLDQCKTVNPLRAAGERCGQCRTSSSHSRREKSTEKHQPISEGISQEPRIITSHTGPQKIAEKISFHVTTNDMIFAEQI